jgi:hypothetical protein
MLCAHAVRKLKPGSFDEFVENFGPNLDDPPPGWVSFNVLRGLQDENEVVTFGFFDGTIDELNSSQEQQGYQERVDAVAPLIESVVVNGVYEVVVDWTR